MRRRFKSLAAAVAAAAALVAAGCSSDADEEEPGELPDAGELLAESADEMGTVETVRLQIEADTDLAELPVREADAVVTAEGDAQGTAQIEQFGQLVELEFVMVGESFHYLLIGDWVEIPRADAATLYDVSAILDPDRGVANLLRSADDPEVRGQETVDGMDTYEVTATFGESELGTVLPGVPETVPGTVWIGTDDSLLHRAEFDLPGGTATIMLSEFDEPVTIEAP